MVLLLTGYVCYNSFFSALGLYVDDDDTGPPTHPIMKVPAALLSCLPSAATLWSMNGQITGHGQGRIGTQRVP